MPKLAPVTESFMTQLCELAEDIAATASNYQQRIAQGYVAKLELPIDKASTLLSASRTLADLAHALLIQARLQEQKAELERRLRAETAAERREG